MAWAELGIRPGSLAVFGVPDPVGSGFSRAAEVGVLPGCIRTRVQGTGADRVPIPGVSSA